MQSAQLESIAQKVRQDIVGLIHQAGSGHPAGSLGVVEILIALYFRLLEKSNRLVVSNGHVCPALYAVMAQAGLLNHNELKTYARLGSRLQAHPERTRLPGIETTSGPLGCGLGQGVGMALGYKLDHNPGRIYVLTSDGEHDEGNHWEAVLLGAKHHLENLVVIIDRNNIQIDGGTEEVLPLGDLADEYRAFGWQAVEVDGHSVEALVEACKGTGPLAVIAKTVAGKGVSFMKNQFEWHAKPIGNKELKKALIELKSAASRTLLEAVK